ncbi:unnamed protein product [Miscanthus lutarioriparius]|uniref:S5 DRBM domain-containing protein n=1 Tax=Miscanthus lutarioriparius TaxID=422564 RepID=A0A811PYP1_9POAL|nr:unnamed protein product [Miscanthus lutarioriparius]
MEIKEAYDPSNPANFGLIQHQQGFDVKVIDVNRTCKVTKGGQIAKFTALLATGNYNGVVGFSMKAKGPTAKIAIQRIYLWPGPMRSGMSAAGRTVETVLYLAGFSNVKTKIIGSRNPLNVIKALFIALNAVY